MHCCIQSGRKAIVPVNLVNHLDMWRNDSRSGAGSRCRCALSSTNGCQIVQKGGHCSCNSPSWDIFSLHLQKISKIEQKTKRKGYPLQVLMKLSCGRYMWQNEEIADISVAAG